MRSPALLLGLWLAAACQPDVAQPPAPPRSARAAGERPKGTASGKTVYSYVDARGRIRMADSVEAIPERYRDQVLATDTGRRLTDRLASDRLMVLDLRRSRAGQPLNYSLVDLTRPGVRARAEPAEQPADPGQLARRVVRGGADGLRGLLGLAPARRPSRVLLYSAPWCGFCRKAAAYLRSRGVAFERRDIEADRQAAVELDRKLRAAGLSGAGIPVLDIGGTLVIGFDRARIDALLSAP